MPEVTQPNNQNIFVCSIIPAGIHRKTNGDIQQKFSLSFELYNDHEVLTATSPVNDWSNKLQAWKKNVRSFPQNISALIKKTIKLNISDADGSNLISVDLQFLPAPYNIKSGDVKNFWDLFLGFTKATDSGLQEFKKEKAESLFIPSISRPDMTGSVPFQATVMTPFDHSGQHVVMQDMDFISLNNMLSQLDQASFMKNETERSVMFDGIIKASEIFKQKNANRRAMIKGHDNNKEAYIKAHASYSSHFQNATKKIKATDNKLLQEWTADKIELQTLMYLTNNEPSYIQEAVNKINAYQPLRYMTGTTVDFVIDWTKALSEKFTHECRLTVELPPPDDQRPYYFFTQKTAVKSCSFNPDLILAAPNVNHSDSMLMVGSACKLISYEPENSAQNFQKLAHQSTIMSANLKEEPVPLAFVKNKRFEEEHFSSSGKLSLQSAFKGHGVMQTILKEIRAANNQLCNTQTKGFSAYLTASLKAPLVRTDYIDEQDCIAGYCIYGRREGEKRWKSLTSCEELFNYPGQEIKAAEFKPVELGLPINLLTVTTDVPAGSSATATPGPDGLYGISSGILFYWDGTKISSRNPMTLQEPSTKTDPDAQVSAIAEFEDKKNDMAIEYFSLGNGLRHLFGEDWFPFKKYDPPPTPSGSIWPTSNRDKRYPPVFQIKRTYRFNKKNDDANDQLTLKYGTAYEFLLVAQYHNGFVPMAAYVEQYNANPNAAPEAFVNLFESCRTRPASEQNSFLRHDHIRDLIISLDKDIYQKNNEQAVKAEYSGESVFDLVIRSDGEATSDSCVRYILPPPIPSFTNYLWYERKFAQRNGTLFNTQLDGPALETWYKKYQCRTQPGKPCAIGCEKFCQGIGQPRVYGGKLNYLPDPVVTGFAVRFYLDPERKLRADRFADNLIEYPETFCAYENGSYPQITPWTLILKNDRLDNKEKNKVMVNTRRKEIVVYVRQGFSIYAEIIPTYDQGECKFHPQLPFNKEYFSAISPDKKLYYNTLYSNITAVSFMHASKKPLFKPEIKKIDIYRFHKTEPNKNETNFKAVVTLHFEHLNIWRGTPIPGIPPTGALELFVLWDDYGSNSRDPLKSIRQKKDSSKFYGGYIKVADIKFSTEVPDNQQPGLFHLKSGNTDHLQSYIADVQFFSDAHFPVPYFTETSFRIREVSKFTSYFETGKEELTEKVKETFSLWSNEVILPGKKIEDIVITTTSTNEKDDKTSNSASTSNFMFNNQKPVTPEIERIVPLVIHDTSDDLLTVRGNRFRIYLKNTGRNCSGKAERLGFIISTLDTDKPSIYGGLFNQRDLLSKCGYDVVTDNPINVVNPILTRKQFVTDKQFMGDDYIDDFQPAYEPDEFTRQKDNIGLMTYLPLYDPEQDMWYVDVELKIQNSLGKALHNIFVQLNLVHYQPYSSRYPSTHAGDQEAFDKDYRISNALRADFVSIYPERNYRNPKALFYKTSKSTFIFSAHVNSLFLKNGKLANQFFVHIEKETSRSFWEEVPAALINYTVNGTPRPTVTQKRERDLPILPLDDYSNRHNQEIAISFSLDFEKSFLENYRIVITEIEYHHSTFGLEELHKILASKPYDLAQCTGVRILNTVIIQD